MNIKFFSLGFIVIALFVNPFIHAQALELSTRQQPPGNYIAVITYLHGCRSIYVNYPESVQIIGNDISIQSLESEPRPCPGVPPPPYYREVDAEIGPLEAGEYTLSWEQPGNFDLSTVFTVSEGPFVPCIGCENLSQAPYPESGLWHNPDQSPGSGLNIEIQNGVLAGFFYGYSNDGQPEWQLVSGELLKSEVNGVLWELETTLTRVEGGSCISCEFAPPDQITEGAVIRLEFMQRNYVRVSVGGAFEQHFVPFTYGSSGKAYFAEQTPYLFPEFAENAIFVLTIRPDQGEDIDVYSWESEHVFIQKATVTIVAGITKTSYVMRNHGPGGPIISPTPPPFGVISCEQESVTSAPGCTVEIDGQVYMMPPGNFGDSRFFAEAEGGITVEGQRIDYD